MRTTFLCSLLILGGVCHADRIFKIPTGRKLLQNEAKADIYNIASKDFTYGWVQFSPSATWEFGVSGENLDTENIVWGFNASYTLVNPITDVAPGLSFGMLDLGNDTEDGRTAYVAVTYRIGNEGLLNQFLPTDFTFGFWSREDSFAFVGAELPFSSTIRLLGEYDGDHLTAGFSLTPVNEATFRFLFRGGDPMVGLKLQKRF